MSEPAVVRRGMMWPVVEYDDGTAGLGLPEPLASARDSVIRLFSGLSDGTYNISDRDSLGEAARNAANVAFTVTAPTLGARYAGIGPKGLTLGVGGGSGAGKGTAKGAFSTGSEAGIVSPGAGVSRGAFELAAPGRANDPYSPIAGIPRTLDIPTLGQIEPRPVPWLVDAADDYMRSIGREHQLPAAFSPLNKDRSRRIAVAFDEMRHAPQDPAVKSAYDTMMEETLAQYRALKDHGAEFVFNEGGVDPYAASPALGYLDLAKNKRLSVFPTDEGFGSYLDNVASNPLLLQSGEKFGGKPATMNDLFRAVHDAFGHAAYGNPFFRAPGEERAWVLHSGMYSPEARKAMTSETRGQNSWLNFGPHAEHNKTASGADTIYAPQKIGILPEWVVKEGADGQ